jgi:hypothetical protein
LFFLDHSVSDAAKHGQANAQGVNELSHSFADRANFGGGTVVGTKDGSSHKSLLVLTEQDGNCVSSMTESE